jgi:hypothetical protein
MKSPTTDFTSIKFVQDRFQNSLNSTGLIIWTHTTTFWAEALGRWHLYPTVTGDKTWIHHYEPESKFQSMDWKQCTLHVKMPKSQPTAGKEMFLLFRNYQGLFLEHYQEGGITVNSARASKRLCDKLKSVICSEHQWQLLQCVLLHHNAHSHTAAHTVQMLQQLCVL